MANKPDLSWRAYYASLNHMLVYNLKFDNIYKYDKYSSTSKYCPPPNYLSEMIYKYKIIILKVIFMQKTKKVMSFEYVTEYNSEKHWQNGIKYFQDADL